MVYTCPGLQEYYSLTWDTENSLGVIKKYQDDLPFSLFSFSEIKKITRGPYLESGKGAEADKFCTWAKATKQKVPCEQELFRQQ